METFTKKTFTTSRSLTYTYYDSAPAKPLVDDSKPVLYLMHGFPDNAHLYKAVIPLLNTLPHRIILPDSLGYGESSRPTDPALYNSKDVTTDHAELLAHEQVTRIVAIGHDQGAFLAQRLWLWRPHLVAGVGLLNVAYVPPTTQPFNLAAINDATERASGGYARFAYWELFTSEEAPRIIAEHLDSFWVVLHGDRPHWMRDVFCVRGAMRAFLERDDPSAVELLEYAKAGNGWREDWFEKFRAGDGLASGLCWYRAMKDNHHWAVERELPQERVPITVPTFFLGCERDAVCPPWMIEENRKEGLMPDLTMKQIDSAHWCLMEKPDEVGSALYGWLRERF